MEQSALFNAVNILGVPLDNLTMDQTIRQIMTMVQDYRKDRRPRLVATVNVDFLVNALNWFSSRPRHPELLHILRTADLVTADGMPIVWASRLLGAPLSGRVTGADLVPRLAAAAAKNGKSIYFLGGKGDEAEKAISILRSQNPGLVVAGADAPFVHVDGEALARSEVEDTPIVDRINRSGADILLVAFGNPKQEIWFHRNRSRLKVPVSIGIGGTFAFVAGSVARAPHWMQRTGLEWIFRLLQEPRRLWRRYFIGLLKIIIMLLPVFGYVKIQKLMRRFRQPGWNVLASSVEALDTPLEGTRLIRWAGAFASRISARHHKIVEAIDQGESVILDFSEVEYIDSAGLGFLMKLDAYAAAQRKNLYFCRLAPRVRRVFQVTRLMDLFESRTFNIVDEIFSHIGRKQDAGDFGVRITRCNAHQEFAVSGSLKGNPLPGDDAERLLKQFFSQDTIIDLSEVDFADSAGLGLLLQIDRTILRQNRRCIFTGVRPTLAQSIRIARLDDLFTFAASRSEAQELLQKRTWP